MPRKKKETLPAVITNAPLMQRKKIRKGSFDRYKEQMLVLFAPAIIPIFMKKVLEGIDKGDHRALRLAGEMYGYAAVSGGVTVNANLTQSTVNVQSNEGGFSYESVIRQMQMQNEAAPAIDVQADEVPE